MDQRATDDKTKTAVQNILGGMVLLSLPAIALAMLVGWNNISILTIHYEHITAEFDRLKATLDKFDNERFTAENGNRLSNRMDRLESALHAHDREAQRWIEVIKQTKQRVDKVNNEQR